MCRPCATCGTTDITKFRLYPSGNTSKHCKKCTSKLTMEALKTKKLNPPKAKTKKKFTEGAKQVLGYYELY